MLFLAFMSKSKLKYHNQMLSIQQKQNKQNSRLVIDLGLIRESASSERRAYVQSRCDLWLAKPGEQITKQNWSEMIPPAVKERWGSDRLANSPSQLSPPTRMARVFLDDICDSFLSLRIPTDFKYIFVFCFYPIVINAINAFGKID